MRDGVAVALLAVAALLAVGGFAVSTSDVPATAAPNATFDVVLEDNVTVVVEHAGGDAIAAEDVRLLVYEDRWLLPTRTVHGSTWADDGTIRPGDTRRLADPRIEPGQRLVVRWFGEGGHATIDEADL